MSDNGVRKIFISQPMNGRTNDEIEKERESLIEKAKKHFIGDKVEILDSFFKDFNGNSLAFLGKSITLLSEADIALFGFGWQDARGCKIEHECCVKYGIPVIAFDGED